MRKADMPQNESGKEKIEEEWKKGNRRGLGRGEKWTCHSVGVEERKCQKSEEKETKEWKLKSGHALLVEVEDRKHHTVEAGGGRNQTEKWMPMPLY